VSQDNSESLRFSRSLYRLDAVEQAAAAFAACGNFDVRSDGEDIVVELSNLHPKLADKVVDEFRNHALYATILADRGAGATPSGGT